MPGHVLAQHTHVLAQRVGQPLILSLCPRHSTAPARMRWQALFVH